MIQSTTLKFLKELKKNNNKQWFDEKRRLYEIAKADFYSAIDKLINGIAKFDKPIGDLTPKDCVFRINRDVRFSKDKSPYKTNMGASFTQGGKKINGGGYYFHCEPGESFVGGGFYMPIPPQLFKIRQEIDYNFNEWKKIVENKNFKNFFPKGIDGIEILSRPPKGYDENNPAIDYLKMKGFIVIHPISDADLQQKDTVTKVLKIFEAMKPLIDFLNQAVE